MLDFSKIEAGRMEVSPETFAIATMIQDVVNTVQPLVQQKGNTLTVHCPSTSTLICRLDEGRQVLFNLLSNAASSPSTGRSRWTLPGTPRMLGIG